MTPGFSVEQISLVKAFFKNRPMKIHWIRLPNEVRLALNNLFEDEAIKLKDLASDLDLKIEVIKQLQLEKINVELIIKTIKVNYDDEASRTNAYHNIKNKIEELHGILSCRKLSKVFGIPQSTLGTWFAKEKTRKRVTLNQVKNDSNTAIPSAAGASIKEPKAAPSTIEDTEELRDLQQMLKRHSNKVKKKYSKSEKDLILKLADRFGSKLVHTHVGVSFDTISRLLRQRERGYIVPNTKATFLPVIDTMRKFPGMGPMQIRDYNHRHRGVSMGVNTVRKVMEDNGWCPSYSRKVVISEEPRRYEAIRINYMWHMDFKHFYINKCKVYLFFIEDDCSRFIVGHQLSDAERIEVVIDILSECITLHGKPESIMSDGGSAFYSWRGISKLSKFLEEFGIDQIIAKTPRVNGKVESLNQKVENELLLTQTFSSLNHLETELVQWIGLYNYRRVHQGLGNLLVPADKYYPGANKWFQGNDKNSGPNIMDAITTLLKEFKK